MLFVILEAMRGLTGMPFSIVFLIANALTVISILRMVTTDAEGSDSEGQSVSEDYEKTEQGGDRLTVQASPLKRTRLSSVSSAKK